jgi:hydrogenase nickel incorporation protein HypA/HybF
VTSFRESVEDNMHELGIAEETLKAIETEAARYPNSRVVRAGLRIGELSGVDASALQFAFEAILQGTGREQMKIEIESLPRKQRCVDCTCEFVVRDYDIRCPKCHSTDTICVGGEELDLTFVEVEEYATS